MYQWAYRKTFRSMMRNWKKEYDGNIDFLLKEGLSIMCRKLETTNFIALSEVMNFTWGTSLMIKFERFPRFSEDLDFSMDYSKRNDSKIVKLADRLVFETLEELRNTASSNGIFVFEWNPWQKTIEILWEAGKKKVMKIDYMFSEVVGSERLPFGSFSVRKANDLDIVANKFRRLNETDLLDINFLARNSGVSKSEFANSIFEALVKKLRAERSNLEMEFRALERLWSKKQNEGIVSEVLRILKSSEYFDN